MRRYLVVANQTLGGEHLVKKLRECVASGPCEFHLVVPATDQFYGASWKWDSGDAQEHAERRLEDARERFREAGAQVEGEVGDPDPMTAIENALGQKDFDEVIISTLPQRMSRWLRMDLPSKINRRFGLPVTQITPSEDELGKTWYPW